MELDEIKDWAGVKQFLLERKLVGDKDCMCFPITSCENCKAYATLVDYQQNLASTNYKDKGPVDQFNLSFQDTLEHMKEKYGKQEIKSS
jgi:hypothetical protein